MRDNVQVLYQEELQSSNDSVNEDKPEEDQEELYGCAKVPLKEAMSGKLVMALDEFETIGVVQKKMTKSSSNS
ncbi:hypothetical protein QE152_g37172 [Popillia japonica]|uniref:Uncharacterized protein n=1 Tax=Popillia japonica TaxID=7064 RepID=A0AAW1IBG6_POPJA